MSHALAPENDSERLLFRNLFPNLVRLDCRGELRPGVVEIWREESDGAWAMTLREDAQLGSGARLSAADAVSRLTPAQGAKPPGIDSAVALNEREVRVFFSDRNHDSVLRMLADPGFAMGDRAVIGSSAAAEGAIGIPARGSGPVLELRFPLRGDARDALDRGADLIVTRDQTLIEYAGRRSEFMVHPLPWSRMYVLVQPAAAPPLAAVSSEPERQSLARDAVHGDARAAEPPFWWAHGSCPTVQSRGTPTSDRIVYRLGDELGRALAERLVALAGPAGLQSVGLTSEQLAAALVDGSERAYVLAVPKHSLNACRDLPELPAAARIVPLIESRAHAIVRKGAPPLTVDWDGTIRIVQP